MSGPVAEYTDRHFLKRLLRAHGEFDFPILHLVSFSSSDANLTDQVEELYELSASFGLESNIVSTRSKRIFQG